MDFLSNLNSGLLLDSLSESFIIIDLKGIIQYSNSACEQMFGYAENEIINQSVNILMPTNEGSKHDSFLQHYNICSASKVIGSGPDRPLTGKKKDGSIFPVDIKITPLPHKGENYVIGIIRNLTELISTNHRLNHVLSSTDTVLYTLLLKDDQLTTLWTSQNVMALTGYSYDEVLMPDWWYTNVHPDDKNLVLKNFDLFLQTGKLEQEFRFKTKNNSYIWIQDKLKLVRDSEPLLIHGSWNNITERKNLLSNLIKSEDRLSKSQVFANIGTWDWNIQTGELYWSEMIAPLFGYENTTTEASYDAFLNAIHPDDKNFVLSAINDCIENNTEYDIEHRIIWPDGTVRWIHEKGDVVRNENNEPFHMLGVVTDINERKNLQIKQQQHQQLLNTLHESLSCFTLTSDHKKSAEILLDGLLSFTNSEYGFIGEIKYRNNQPYLKTDAITDISWNLETQTLYEKWREKGFEFTNMNTLFGHVITTSKLVISNDPASDPRARGLPEGHPEMNCFLGIPVYYADDLIGMYALANRPQGYDQPLIDSLRLFTATYASIIQAKKELQQKKQNRRDLLQAKEQAEAANKAKSIFLSSMSHELRTPLNAISGFTQLLRLEQGLSDEAQSNIDDIALAGKHLLELINEVLDLAKIESGTTSISLESVAVSDLFASCASLTAPLAEDYQINLAFSQNGATNAYILADYIKVKQVLINLVSNAIKYNKAGGHVTISCKKSANNTQTISITDDGDGIDEQQQQYLFEPFNRLGAEANTSIEGTGIGLSITKKLLALMDGTIQVNSRLGQGSEFSFTLAAATEKMYNTITEPHHKKINRQHNGKKIYYIEDNQVNLRMVKQLINKWTDFEFSGSADPLIGIEEIKNFHPDIILLDINLPKMSGYQVFQYLKDNNICPGTPIFAVTANAMEEDADKVKETGFDEYICKPINIESMLEKLNSVK
ncbi:MAG: PAS domain-containing protein [Gammaproteobacteria bacterium]|nr:PAS domain-containing protein [Gammaproteobacteria bacterium]